MRIRFTKISLFRMVLKRLKLPQFFNGVARTFPEHKHGCRKRGKNLKISAKKAVFLVSRGENLISPLLAPLEKLLENSTSASPEKNPSDANAYKHVKLHHFCENCVVVTPSGNTVQQHQCGKQFIAGRQTVHGVFCQTIQNPDKFLTKLQIIY